MQLLQSIILGIVQGLTEFIPVSSSGHLIVVGHFLHFQYSGLAFDTALDVGTLAALYLFFWRDFWNMAVAVLTNKPGNDRKLGWLIILGTIPAGILGLLFQKTIDRVFHAGPHATLFVAINLIWIALAMLFVDKSAKLNRKLDDMNTGDAGAVGLAQALALIPGISRSGITITAGRALGFDRVAITRFSFLLSAPIITLATLKVLAGHDTVHQMIQVPLVYAAGIIAAFVAGYWSIKFLIDYLGKHGLSAFAYYRIVVGVLILVLVR